jgi:hypothetical protein
MNETRKHDTDLIATELAEIEPTEDEDFDAPLPSHVRVSRGHSRTRVLQVRLNDDEMERLNRIADDTGVPASTYARMLLLEGMDDRRRPALPMLDPTTPGLSRRIQRALSNDAFNVIVATALAVEETNEGHESRAGGRILAKKPRPRQRLASAKRSSDRQASRKKDRA